MNTMIRKAAIGGALVLATITGGAIGASFMGTASAQTNDTTTTQPSDPATTDAKPAHDGNCPDKDGDGVPDTPRGADTSATTSAS